MANKLKDLRITKVDLVDAGANQRADVMLYKHAPEEKKEEAEDEKNEGLGGLVKTIAKKLGIIQKDARSFADVQAERSLCNACVEVHDMAKSLLESMDSVLCDTTAKDRAGALKQNIDQFCAAAKSAVDKYATPKAASVEKREEQIEMKIDESKMTPGERAFYSEIVKRYGVPDEPTPAPAAMPAPAIPPVEAAPQEVAKSADDKLSELMKRLDPILDHVKAIEKKAADAEFMEVAKRYEILGEKAEELAPVLKSAKEVSDEAYETIVKQLDKAVEVTKKSGLFDEIGKRGGDEDLTDDQKVDKFAAEIRKSKPELNIYEARDLAYQQHPELIH